MVHPSVAKKIDKKASIVYAELSVEALGRLDNGGIHYEEASKYPGMEVDLTLLSDVYAPIEEAIANTGSPLIKKVKVVDIYRGGDGKAITVRLTFSCMDRTLTREEVQAVTDQIIGELEGKGIQLKK